MRKNFAKNLDRKNIILSPCERKVPENGQKDYFAIHSP
jgi:hypothetical protein